VVIGAGTMGGGIAMNFLNAGIPVVLLEMKQEALDRGWRPSAELREHGEEGQAQARQVEQRMGLLTRRSPTTTSPNADLVIEAVFENMDVKEQVFKTLDEVMQARRHPGQQHLDLDVDTIAEFTKRPQDVIGLHFFSPANVMKLLEVVRGAGHGARRAGHGMKLAKTIRKTAVVSGVCDGFIGNRMIALFAAGHGC
jgi:3-hydroxyacyl-CoA dehydrogenase